MLSFSPRDVLDEILNLIESLSEGFPIYSFKTFRPHEGLLTHQEIITENNQITNKTYDESERRLDRNNVL